MNLIPVLKCRKDDFYVGFKVNETIPKNPEEWVKNNPDILVFHDETKEYIKLGDIVKIFDEVNCFGNRPHVLLFKPKKRNYSFHFNPEGVELIIANHTKGNSHVGDVVVMKDGTVHVVNHLLRHHEFQEYVEEKLEEGWKVYHMKKYDDKVKRAIEIIKLRRKLGELEMMMKHSIRSVECMKDNIKELEEDKIPKLAREIQEVNKQLDDI